MHIRCQTCQLPVEANVGYCDRRTVWKICLKNECKITILHFPYGASVEDFNLIILRSKWSRIVTISYRSD